MEEEFGPTPSKQIKEENIKRGISPWHAAPVGPRAPPFLCEGWVGSCQEELTRDRIGATPAGFPHMGVTGLSFALGEWRCLPSHSAVMYSSEEAARVRACAHVCVRAHGVCQCRLREPIGGNSQQEAGHAHKASGSQLSVTWSHLHSLVSFPP